MHDNERAKRIAVAVITALAPQFTVQLWDGTRYGPQAGPVLLINDEGLIRQLILKPKLDTIIEAWMSKAIDIENGTLFDILALRGSAKFKQQLKQLPKWQIMKDLPALILSARGTGASGLEGKNPYHSGSNQEDITHHYDVSNAFYQTFLDERMVYTCGYFRDWNNSIDQAQFDKLELICRKLRLAPGDRLLDIGCGWGALLIHAAKYYGAIGTGVSLSEAQTKLAREKISSAGLDGRITIHIQSYEQLGGQFDKISSVGMFEHVGAANYDLYFSTVSRLLKPGGLYLHHAITRRNKGSKRAFIRKRPEQLALAKYIFPGGELDHLAMTIGNLELYGFEVHDAENLREHYGRTCRMWAERLHGNMEASAKEAGEKRARLWLFYLTACAIAFERGTVQINQILASKRSRGVSVVPQTRSDLYHNWPGNPPN